MSDVRPDPAVSRRPLLHLQMRDVEPQPSRLTLQRGDGGYIVEIQESDYL